MLQASTLFPPHSGVFLVFDMLYILDLPFALPFGTGCFWRSVKEKVHPEMIFHPFTTYQFVDSGSPDIT